MARDQAYYEAEKKIEEARRSGAKELDLSAMYTAKDDEKLSELPESLGTLVQLQSLNLSNNELIILPEWLGQLTQLQSLKLSENQLITLPESLVQLRQLQELDLRDNQLKSLPDIGDLSQIKFLYISNNQLSTFPEWLKKLEKLEELQAWKNGFTQFPEWIGELSNLNRSGLGSNPYSELPGSIKNLKLKFLGLGTLVGGPTELRKLPIWIKSIRSLGELALSECALSAMPEWIGELTNLHTIHLEKNQITDIPPSLAQLEHLKTLYLDGNPLNPELDATYKQGLDAVKVYLRAKAAAQIVLNEAKLILVGEGEVGKSCLLGALRGDAWEENRPTTHGIEIKSVKVTDPDSKKEITLNGWDFGGQRVYRPTHQLFFSAPAVYLVVWKPREGPQQGFVKEWIKLVKHREPDAKILVVATHRGPQQRQPDIDRQELRDLFGADTVIDFFHVESKPDKNGTRRGIPALKDAIARVAAQLPEMGRSVPKRWQDARIALEQDGAAYLPFDRVLELCRELKMDDDEARLFITIEHRLGHLIHYEHDPALRDIVVLKPNWLSTAISYVLDDRRARITGWCQLRA